MSSRNWTMGAFIHIFNNRNELLCVRQAYANHNWTTPGGKIENGEDPTQAVLRETKEEVDLDISKIEFNGLYWKAYSADLVFSFVGWYEEADFNFSPNTEISDARFFKVDGLPSPMAFNTKIRIEDAVKKTGGRLVIFHAYDRYFVV